MKANRTQWVLRAVSLLLAVSCSAIVIAQEHTASAATGASPQEAAAIDATPHPVISHDVYWVGLMLIAIGAMFVFALGVGITARANMPEELPPPPMAHSHDEPPGASHHHGPSGMVQPPPHDVREPEHGGGHGHGHSHTEAQCASAPHQRSS